MQYFYIQERNNWRDRQVGGSNVAITHESQDRETMCVRWHPDIFELFAEGVLARIDEWLDKSGSLYCLSGMCRYSLNTTEHQARKKVVMRVEIWIDDDAVATLFKLSFC